MTNEVYVVAILTSKTEKVEGLRELLTPATEAFRQEDGCKAYSLHEDLKRLGRFVTYELWRDEAALAAHMQSATMKAAVPKLALII